MIKKGTAPPSSVTPQERFRLLVYQPELPTMVLHLFDQFVVEIALAVFDSIHVSSQGIAGGLTASWPRSAA
ncbi:hypothetical protein KAJ02_09165 [Candidatus Bipolaricaulota bacterium]|nr:hypothetical protein [Candidatus Bipolaricaulota bacterium]